MTINLRQLYHNLIQCIKAWLKEGSPDAEAPHPKSTVKENFELWQAWEKNLLDSIRDFKDTLDKAIMVGRQRGIPHPENVGLIKQAFRETENIPTRKILQKQRAVKRAFERHMHDQKKKTPPTIIKLLKDYGDTLEQKRQEYQRLQNRLSLIITLLNEVTGGEPWTENLPTQLLLEHPETYETMLRIEQSRWKNQQLCHKRLHNCFENRFIIAERWLMLIKLKLTNYEFRLKKRRLSELWSKFSKINGNDINSLKNLHEQLDKLLLSLNKQSLMKNYS